MNRIAKIGLAISTLAALTELFAAVGYRLGLLSVRLSLLTIMRWGAYAAAAGAVLCLVALIAILAARSRRGGLTQATIGLVVGAIAFAIPARLRYESNRNGYPPIHDISTDTQDPPLFVDVLPLRANAPNKVEYGGPRIAALQQKAYPDLVPITLNEPPERAFDRALAAVNDMGWDMVAANREARRIEATDTTFWFGFKDDVVIRLRPAEGGTRIDVRSLSRVGGGDVGTNAKRIRAYVTGLKEQ